MLKNTISKAKEAVTTKAHTAATVVVAVGFAGSVKLAEAFERSFDKLHSGTQEEDK